MSSERDVSVERPIPEEWVEMAARAVAERRETTNAPASIARAVIAAVRPLIEQEAREEAERSLRAIYLHGTDEYPCHAICDADCIDSMRETARTGLLRLRLREGGRDA